MEPGVSRSLLPSLPAVAATVPVLFSVRVTMALGATPSPQILACLGPAAEL